METILAMIGNATLAPFIGNILGFVIAVAMALTSNKSLREKDKQSSAVVTSYQRMLETANAKCDERVEQAETRCQKRIDELEQRVDELTQARAPRGGVEENRNAQ